MAKDESPKFDHRKAASLMFPERAITDTFHAKFQEDRMLVAVRKAYDLHSLMSQYQQAYFDEKMGDANWLRSVSPNIVSMCTEGCVPYLDFSNSSSRTKWTPVERDFEIQLKWLSQAIRFEFCGRIGKDCYYETDIVATRGDQTEGVSHALGTRVLVGLAFNESEFAQYHLKHAFERLGYESRLRIPVVNGGDVRFQRLKEAVREIAREVFMMFEKTDVPLFSYPDSDGKKLRLVMDQVQDHSGSITATFSLGMFISTSGDKAHNAMEIDVGLQIEHNRFSNDRALNQLRAVEAMNFFLVKFKQLKRGLESE